MISHCHFRQVYAFKARMSCVIGNVQKVRRIQLRYAESEYFKVVCPTAKKQRVASGLAAKYLIRFSPDMKKVATDHAVMLCVYSVALGYLDVVCDQTMTRTTTCTH